MMKIWKPRSRQEPSTTSVQTRQSTASAASSRRKGMFWELSLVAAARPARPAPMMSDYKVSDLGHHGHRHIHGVCYLAKWLERALASLGWQTSFPEDYVETLCRLHFDHSPIILRYGDRLD
ncbi:hypothetical protein NC651_036811 [Populus alba x Populus x berolinensis]|nr:hypothetical protein NC651_036811 [Populus alba x Populus x berolinensis]